VAFGSPPGPCLTAHQQRRTLDVLADEEASRIAVANGHLRGALIVSDFASRDIGHKHFFLATVFLLSGSE
jgi:hypothetical protein